MSELEFASESAHELLEMAQLVRQCRIDLAPDWPEIVLLGQVPPGGRASINHFATTLATFAVFRQTYQSLCTYHSMPVNVSAQLYVENLYAYGERDFVLSDVPGADLPSSGQDKDVIVSANLLPLILALRYNRYFCGLILNTIQRRELLPSVSLVLRSNFVLTRLTVCNVDADGSSLTEMALSLKENAACRVQMIDFCDLKSMDHHAVAVLASLITTFPTHRVSHLSLARCGLPGKAISKIFTAFNLNHSISVGLTSLNLSGAKFDSDTLAALELWLEVGGNYSNIEELALADVSNFPFKVLPKFKALQRLSRIDFSSNRLDSSSDTKLLAQFLSETPSVRRINLSNCSIEKSSVLDLLFDAFRRMKMDELELNLSNNAALATEQSWAKVVRECKLKSLLVKNIHFKDSVLDLLLTNLKSVRGLTQLSLEGCKTKPRQSETITQIAKEFFDLRELSFSNALDNASIIALINELADSTTSKIERFDMSMNALGDDLVAPLCRLIATSKSLTLINCDGNGLSLSGWQAVYQALRSTSATTHTIQYPSEDLPVLLSWASSSPIRQASLAKTLLNIHELLASVTIGQEQKRGGFKIADFSSHELWKSHIEPLGAAQVPSHLASQHTELKLEDLGGDLVYQPSNLDIYRNASTDFSFGSLRGESRAGAIGSAIPGLSSSNLNSSTGSNGSTSTSNDQISSTTPPQSNTPLMGRAAIVKSTGSGSLRKPSVSEVFAHHGGPSPVSTPPVSLTGSGQLAVPGNGTSTANRTSPPASPRSHSVSVSTNGSGSYGLPPKGYPASSSTGTLPRLNPSSAPPSHLPPPIGSQPPAMPSLPGVKRAVPKVPLPHSPQAGGMASPSRGPGTPHPNGAVSPGRATSVGAAGGPPEMPHLPGTFKKTGAMPPKRPIPLGPGVGAGSAYTGPHSPSPSSNGLPSPMQRQPSGSLNDEFGLNPASPLKFGTYGQVDEEIDAQEPVRRASLNEMVIRLCHEASSDVKFMHTFLLTYRATVEPAELLDRLITRYFTKPPPGRNSGPELKQWFEQTLRPIRVRVMNVLKRWCEAHWQDFANEPSLVASLEAFLRDSVVVKLHESSVSILLGLIQSHKGQGSHAKQVVNVATLRHRMDEPGSSSSSSVASLGDGDESSSSGMIGVLSRYSPEEVAEQICLLECDLFSALQVKEFFNQGWNKGTNEQKDAAAPNIRLMIQVSNQIITWVAYEILRQPNTAARAKAISRAIQLAQALFDRKNFNGLKEVTAGLALSAIQRLKKSWAAVKPKTKQMYTELTDKCDNMQSLRILAQSSAPPLVPYLGVYLTDLVFIEDGNPNTFEEDGMQLINFRKMSIMGEVLMEISSFQHDPYSFFKFDDLYNYLLYLETHTDTDLYNMSVAAEPRKK